MYIYMYIVHVHNVNSRRQLEGTQRERQTGLPGGRHPDSTRHRGQRSTRGESGMPPANSSELVGSGTHTWCTECSLMNQIDAMYIVHMANVISGIPL